MQLTSRCGAVGEIWLQGLSFRNGVGVEGACVMGLMGI